MRNEIKILIGAIIVIIIVLVGAYALSGSNTVQPSATPTVTPVTATPTSTPVPAGGGGGTGVGTPSPGTAPTVTATPTPTITPTPEPESGVKQTEFGYYITYPPLGPQNWSTNPPPQQGEWNVVYFDPVSENLNIELYAGGVEPANSGPTGTATVHRYGEMGGTVNVTIVATNSSNTWLVRPNYIPPYQYMYNVAGLNLTQVGNNTYMLRFDPGVSQQNVYIQVWDVYIQVWDYSVKSAGSQISVIPDGGFVKLTITDADGGYQKGAKDQYTLNVNHVIPPVVQFATDTGDLVTEAGCVVENYSDSRYNISFVITRTGDLSGTFTPDVYLDESYPSSDGCIGLIKVDPFVAGASTTKAYMYYELGHYYTGYGASIMETIPYAEFGLNYNSYYTVGSPSMYTIYMNDM